MISRITGALTRAFSVSMLFALPSLTLPASSHADGTVLLVVVLASFAWTYMEYVSAYPNLLEFRDAPPFNRIRFLSLFAIVFALSQIQVFALYETTISAVMYGIGRLVGYSLNFPYSPVRLMSDLFPAINDASVHSLFQASVGLAYLISLIAILAFTIALHLNRWPRNNGPFNVWINLPTFDPTSTDDVVGKLNRDGRINIILGFALPFFIPIFASVLSGFVPVLGADNPFVMIWVVSAWAFLPSSLIMRGIAMQRVGQMITAHQRIIAAKEEGLTAFVS